MERGEKFTRPFHGEREPKLNIAGIVEKIKEVAVPVAKINKRTAPEQMLRWVDDIDTGKRPGTSSLARHINGIAPLNEAKYKDWERACRQYGATYALLEARQKGASFASYLRLVIEVPLSVPEFQEALLSDPDVKKLLAERAAAEQARTEERSQKETKEREEQAQQVLKKEQHEKCRPILQKAAEQISQTLDKEVKITTLGLYFEKPVGLSGRDGVHLDYLPETGQWQLRGTWGKSIGEAKNDPLEALLEQPDFKARAKEVEEEHWIKSVAKEIETKHPVKYKRYANELNRQTAVLRIYFEDQNENSYILTYNGSRKKWGLLTSGRWIQYKNSPECDTPEAAFADIPRRESS